MSNMIMGNLDMLLYLSEDNWEYLEKTNTTFSPSFVKTLVDKIRMYKFAVDTVTAGKLDGYAITCPHCGTTYDIKVDELNYAQPVTCMDCGGEYIQSAFIDDIICRAD